ncbi:tetratricopeptide repeat protein [Synechocystis sp. LKSZ1]|uniref:tetratricopeptide repeat protein n=1 Tax=Synechocystis sp. LKSZ1 TaxID=3144951 RepID=UPI00336BEF53
MSDSSASFREQFQAGRDAFERGQYRQSITAFEAALKLTSLGSREGGETQLWLVMAYQAAGDLSEARNLCRKLTRHPDPDCRKQSKQVLYILEAPRLARPKEWLTEIPDLSQTEGQRPAYVQFQRAKKEKPPPSPIYFEDTSRINTRDNGFILVAIALAVVLIGGLIWFA